MKKVFASDDSKFNNQLSEFISNFNSEGQLFNNGERNVIKTKQIESTLVNVKSFRVPNLINKIVYRFFRKSKAQRSFEFAQYLQSCNVGTPKPLGYFENKGLLTFKDSYYASEHLQADLTYRDLTTNFNYPNYEDILRAFTRFSYSLHEKGINFLDHSPGNTLIKKDENQYHFYLVDLNRMKFGHMDFNTRMKNLSKLTIHKSMIEIMSSEYALVSGEDEDKVFKTMWQETQDFQYRYHRKKRLKKKLKFWKK
ncbi:lipopolysaccharide kinase (Kdo/WaaP) family protein [Winogradskyella wandonensis]|uniref:Lipopolysaccharide kinase (Kdo/WaaP) family protein n=1 Tax=Winogradskyella wandonensis TaxID=1442586 RepID=A0A4R1KQF7_9FLAO|nr:Kdo domain containing protein [Winogradskyella wandonensis]TCK66737.1 lipopolysaccharide kinase (Kdo/WaaP) family protein [Winogradskyella wandonensis]